MKQKVILKNGKLQCGKESLALISGEFHYWRTDPLYWERILDSIRELGLQFIASYVCWEFHQTGKGKFDFTGKTHPRRNLKSFLELTQEKGFKLFIRPGPYIYSEWKNLGIPDEAARHHRLSPEFLNLAKPYIKEVSSVIKPFLATQGGHVVLFQADNEIDMIAGGFEAELGLSGNKKGAYQIFLEKKYQTVDVLNKHWGSQYRSFDRIPAVTSWSGKDEGIWRRYYDYREFAHAYTQEKASWMVDEFKKQGIDVPCVLNTYSEFEVQNWRDMETVADLVGVDVYPENEFLAGPDSHRLFLERLRLLSSYSKAPYIVEFESGLWHGFIERVKNLSPRHYELCSLTALLAGVVGWNWYMLVNRDNWYQAPITELGDFRLDLKPSFQKVVQLYQEFDPAQNRKVCHTAVTFSYAHHRMGKAHQLDLLLQSLYQADIDFDFCDLSLGKNAHALLFYSGEEWLPQAEHQFLLEHVEAGGTLVCFKTAPRYDEALKPYNLLNLPFPDAILGGREVMSHQKEIMIEWKKGLTTKLKSEIFIYPEIEQAKSIWATQSPSTAWELQWKQADDEKYRVGLIIKRGKGQIFLLGVDPTPELLVSLHQFCSTPIPVISSTANVQSALFQRKGTKEFFLVLTHNQTEKIETSLLLSDIKKISHAKSLSGLPVTVSLSSKGVQLHVTLPPKSGDIVKFQALL